MVIIFKWRSCSTDSDTIIISTWKLLKLTACCCKPKCNMYYILHNVKTLHYYAPMLLYGHDQKLSYDNALDMTTSLEYENKSSSAQKDFSTSNKNYARLNQEILHNSYGPRLLVWLIVVPCTTVSNVPTIQTSQNSYTTFTTDYMKDFHFFIFFLFHLLDVLLFWTQISRKGIQDQQLKF